jgi:hypothetical protein
MKIRTAFVSNSSSSSFVIEKKYLSPEQIKQIVNHSEIGEEMGLLYSKSDNWEVKESKNVICCYTWMDNFDMKMFLEKINVPMANVQWDD